MDARNRSLDDWFSRIRTGQVRLPRFQRFEAWGSSEVADLLQTVIDELPAGAVLVLEIGDRSPFDHRPLAGAPEPTERITELLLDGQQRLTALWRSLTENYPDRSFFVETRDIDADEDGRRDFRVIPQGRWWRKGTRYPMWCDEPPQVHARNLIPLGLLNPDNEDGFRTWISAATGGDMDQMFALQELVLNLRQRVARFNLPYLALQVGSSEAVVLNVFVKMNTRSVPLTAFDIIVARVEGEAGESLHDLVAALDGQVPGLSRYVAPADLVLPAAAFLQDRRPTQRELVFMDFRRLIEDWHLIVRGAEHLVGFLEQERIPDAARLPTEVVLAPLVALWAHAPDHPDQLGAVRTLLRKYLWRSAITTRYEYAAATASFQDFRGLLPAVQSGGTTEPTAEILTLALPELEEIKIASWPKKRDRLARAILAVSFLGGAHDIADGSQLTPENAQHREYHHLFPVAYLNDNGIDERAASVALNCALITWRTNRTISAKPPLEYLADRALGAPLGEGQVRDRLTTHGIDFDDLAAGNFDLFLDNRAVLVRSVFVRLAEGGVWPA
jgi:hypothetical protein